MRRSSFAAAAIAAMAPLAVVSVSHATVVYYNGTGGNADFDVSYSTPGGTNITNTTGPESLGAATFINGGDTPPNYQASAADTRFYGGTITYSQGNDQGYVAPDLSFDFNSISGGTPVTFSVPDTSPTYWTVGGYDYPGQLTGTNPEANPGAMPLPSTVGTFDFVMEITDLNYGPALLSFYLGSNADSPTQPTTPDYQTLYDPADYDYGINGITDLSTLTISLIGYSDDATPSSLVTSNFFGSTVWTPVGEAVPEPATIALAGLSMLGLLARRRKPTRA